MVSACAVLAFGSVHGATWSKRASKFAQAESVEIDAVAPEISLDSHHESIRSTVLLQSALSKKAKAISEVVDDRFGDFEGEMDAVPSAVCSETFVQKGGARPRQVRKTSANSDTHKPELTSERSYWANFHFDLSVIVLVFLATMWYQGHVVSAPSTVSVRFEPGSLGLRLDSATGVVIGVKADAQAARKGVDVNMVLEKVNGLMYTKDLLDHCILGKEDFTVVFKVS